MRTDEVAEVEAAGALVEVEPEADGVVGIRRGSAGFGRGEVPEADGVGGGGELAAVDLLEPGSLEQFAVVGDVPVAVEEAFAFGVGEDGE